MRRVRPSLRRRSGRRPAQVVAPAARGRRPALLVLLALLIPAGCGAPPPTPTPVARPQPLPAQPRVLRARLPLPPVLRAQGGADDKPQADGLAGAWARVFVRANPGPFQYVAYEITARGSAGVMSHLRGMMGRRDAVIRTNLVSRARLRAVFQQLNALGAAQLLPPNRPTVVSLDRDDDRKWPDRSKVPIYELSFRLGKTERTVVIADPFRDPDPRYVAFINAVRGAVVRTVGDIGYHGATGAAGQTGYVHIDSVPGATVRLDGVLLPNRTPVLAFPTKPGPHTVVLENKALGLKRTFTVRVRAGRSTSLEVDLR